MVNDIDEKIKQNNIEKQMRQHNYGQRLFHYTSIDALYGIMKKGELWLGNTATMNDKFEIINFIAELQDALMRNLPESKQTDCKKLFDEIKDRQKNEYPFALCLSRLEDNAAQWDRYANHGTGVCIAFNTKALMRLFYHGFLFCEVYYEYDITDHQHYKLLYEYLSTGRLSSFHEKKSLIDNILACAYIHKHKSFGSEQEVRATTLWKRIPWGDLEKCVEKEYVCQNGMIKSVLKLHLPIICDIENVKLENLIDSIIIGPCSKQSEQTLRNFVVTCGYPSLAERIATSSCPLQ